MKKLIVVLLAIVFVSTLCVATETEIIELVPHDADEKFSIGQSVDIDGDIAVVGAPRFWAGGAVYVFERDHDGVGNWGETKKITPTNSDIGDQFGRAVSLEGDTLAVGSRNDDDAGENAGAVYIYRRFMPAGDTVADWEFVQKITASDPAPGDRFGGRSISLSGDTLVVGAHEKDSFRGAVYIFYRNHGGIDNWGQIRKIHGLNTEAWDYFGYSVSVDGDVLAVGAPADFTTLSVGVGTVHLFLRNLGVPDEWGQENLSSAGTLDNLFGWSVSVSGRRIAISSVNNDILGFQAGAVHVLHDSDTSSTNFWEFEPRVSATDGGDNDQFGISVALDGNRMIVGAVMGAVNDPNTGSGAVYFFDNDSMGNPWTQDQKVSGMAGAGAEFGWSTALDGCVSVVGAPWSNLYGDVSGAAYLIDRCSPVVGMIFTDGFESGDLSSWSSSTP